jgi:hypothetical protein
MSPASRGKIIGQDAKTGARPILRVRSGDNNLVLAKKILTFALQIFIRCDVVGNGEAFEPLDKIEVSRKVTIRAGYPARERRAKVDQGTAAAGIANRGSIGALLCHPL